MTCMQGLKHFPSGKCFVHKDIFCVAFPLQMEQKWICFDIRIKSSHKAYCSHLTQIFRKVDEILEKDTPIIESQVATITSGLEQLTKKKETFQHFRT